MFDDHNRFKVVSELQHILDHDFADFSYTHPALPDTITNAQQAMDYVFNVLYPRNKASVANVAALPGAGNTLGDQRIVQDDGDGNAAWYVWSQMEDQGQNAPQWNKIADLDWGLNSVVQALNDQTQYLYPRKFGTTDYNPVTEVPFAGDLAGQHLYGGDSSGQNLILHANNGDDSGVHTGSINFDDPAKPLADLAYDFGTATQRWDTGYFGTLVVGTASMTITSNGTTGSITDTNGVITFGDEDLNTTGNFDASIITASTNLVVDNGANSLTIGVGSITDTTGAISFGNENLSTTGTLGSGLHTVSGTLALDSGSITDTSGAISFGDENLSTTGTLGAGVTTATQLNVDDLRLDGNTVSITTLNTDLALLANGTGVVDVQSAMTTLGQTVTGTVDITGQLDVDDLTFNGDTISSTGNILFANNFAPNTNGTLDIGLDGSRIQNIKLAGSLSDGTDSIAIATLLSFRNALVGAATGHALFYNGVSGLWESSLPDSEIDHGTLLAASLLDDDHTQYALLAGRAGGETIHGSPTAGETLTLLNNDDDADGLVLKVASVDPNAAGYNLGSSGNEYGDIHMTGQGIGFRAENDSAADIATAAGAAGGEGRLWYSNDAGVANKFLYIDVGTSAKKIGHNTYNTVFTEVTLLGAHDLTGIMADTRNAIFQVTDASNNEEVMGLQITKTSSTNVTVSIAAGLSLPGGNYRLMGIEL